MLEILNAEKALLLLLSHLPSSLEQFLFVIFVEKGYLLWVLTLEVYPNEGLARSHWNLDVMGVCPCSARPEQPTSGLHSRWRLMPTLLGAPKLTLTKPSLFWTLTTTSCSLSLTDPVAPLHCVCKHKQERTFHTIPSSEANPYVSLHLIPLNLAFWEDRRLVLRSPFKCGAYQPAASCPTESPGQQEPDTRQERLNHSSPLRGK